MLFTISHEESNVINEGEIEISLGGEENKILVDFYKTIGFSCATTRLILDLKQLP